MCLGRTDLFLSEEGWQQAYSAAALLSGKCFQVYASPLLRALQTAEAFHRPITVLEGLRELDMGQWDGLTFDEIRIQYPQLYAAREYDKTLLPPGAESHQVGLERFRSALTAAAENALGDLAVVSHSGVIELFLKTVSEIQYKPAYGEILYLTYENNKFQYLGGIDHA